MAKHYKVDLAQERDGVVTLQLSFGEPAHNDDVVRDALQDISALRLKGGKAVKLTGPASLPVAVAIGHAVAHLFGFVACFDPKLNKYVVCISHDPAYAPGDLID